MPTKQRPIVRGLTVRKLADRTDPAAKAADLPGAPPGTWPCAGWRIEGEVPARVRVPSSFVLDGIAAGWIVGEGLEVVTRPAGRADAPWAPTPNAPGPHVFHHYSGLTLLTVDGPIRYAVTRQPDKYADPGDDATPVTSEAYAAGATRVDWSYELELAGEEG